MKDLNFKELREELLNIYNYYVYELDRASLKTIDQICKHSNLCCVSIRRIMNSSYLKEPSKKTMLKIREFNKKFHPENGYDLFDDVDS